MFWTLDRRPEDLPNRSLRNDLSRARAGVAYGWALVRELEGERENQNHGR